MQDDIRIATVIFNSPVGQINQNLDRMAAFIRKASDEGAQIVCFPELSITGYSSSGGPIEKAAVELNGWIAESLEYYAEKENIVILSGLAEKDQHGNIYASHIVSYPDHKTLSYRKLHLAPPEKKVLTPGTDLPIFEVNGFRFGIQLCYDVHFPELTTKMAVEGVDAVFAPHASPRGTASKKFNSWMRHLPARAFDNGIFVIAVNQCGENGSGLYFPGVSIVIGPTGEVIDKSMSDTEVLLISDLKKEQLDYVRTHRMRYFLPNRRPDIY